jgi:hypothetical protein
VLSSLNHKSHARLCGTYTTSSSPDFNPAEFAIIFVPSQNKTAKVLNLNSLFKA